MEQPDAPLYFLAPARYRNTALRSAGPPPAALLHLPYARQELLQWGTGNFVYQQFYAGSDFAIALIDIEVAAYTLLELQCTRPFNGLQYTLEGYAFALLAGYGNLRLFKDTYTLQYVPEGRHRLLLPKGAYCFFYADPGRLLANLVQEHPPVQQLIGMEAAMEPKGRLATRLPVIEPVRQLINGFAQLPACNGNTALLIATRINALTRYYHQQAKQPVAALPTPELLSEFIADHLQLPESQFFSKLRQTWFISPSTLERLWHRRHPASFRSTASRLRMLLGLYLLVVEKYHVCKAADLLGYLNPSDFSRQFKKHLGFAPSKALSHVCI